MTSHYVTVSHICKIFNHGRSEANRSATEQARVRVSGDGSGVCELANQSRLGVQEGGFLKRKELKQSISDGGGIKNCNNMTK